MNELAEKFTDWARDNGWNVEIAAEKQALPDKAAKRYAFIPDDWREFIGEFESIVNGDNNIWFLTAYELAEDNEFETISLNASDGDEEWRKNILGFWDNFIPIVMSVAGDYHYYAICVKTGEVFEGWEPEFEEPEICAVSFTDFLEKIIAGKIVLM